MKKSLLVGLGIFGFCAVVSASETAQSKTEIEFKTLDTDKNGSLSQKEIASKETISKNFASLDKDKDGGLSKSEFEALHALTKMD